MPFEIVKINYEATCKNCNRTIKKGEKRLRYISPKRYRNTTHRISKSLCSSCLKKLANKFYGYDIDLLINNEEDADTLARDMEHEICFWLTSFFWVKMNG